MNQILQEVQRWTKKLECIIMAHVITTQELVYLYV